VSIFEFNEEAHEYRVDGVRYPSVTEIIRPLSADWLARIPADVLERKRAFGVAVHQACEWDDNGELDDESTDPRVMGCVNGWRSFKRALNVEVISNELRMYSKRLGCAGTLDRFARMSVPFAKDVRTFWLLDIKTGAEAHASYGVQLAAYLMLLAEQEQFAARSIRDQTPRGTVHLFDDGTYQFNAYTNPNDAPMFRACLAMHHWKESCK